MISVSRPYLPPLEELTSHLTKAWSEGVITNNGPLVQEFENKLKEFTGVRHAFLVANGTIAIQIALRALNIKGKILTTPFSMMATLSSILWERYQPCFADIDPYTLNISPDEVEKEINDNIGCILATHVYGNSCDIQRLDDIAKSRNIPLVFDAAHAFGSTYLGRDIMSYGTISVLSLQAFKILHSGEGGVVFTNDNQIAETIFRMRYFGYDKNMEAQTIGINGKTSEINAALGLCVFNHFGEIQRSRQAQSIYYDSLLSRHNLRLKRPVVDLHSKSNYSYYALIFDTEDDILRIKNKFEENDIQFKRYFYPSLNTVRDLKTYQSMPVSESIASRVICLPLYFSLTEQQQELVINSIVSAFE